MPNLPAIALGTKRRGEKETSCKSCTALVKLERFRFFDGKCIFLRSREFGHFFFSFPFQQVLVLVFKNVIECKMK